MNKIKLIKAYSGKDILSTIQNNVKNNEETTRKATTETKVNTSVRGKK